MATGSRSRRKAAWARRAAIKLAANNERIAKISDKDAIEAEMSRKRVLGLIKPEISLKELILARLKKPPGT